MEKVKGTESLFLDQRLIFFLHVLFTAAINPSLLPILRCFIKSRCRSRQHGTSLEWECSRA